MKKDIYAYIVVIFILVVALVVIGFMHFERIRIETGEEGTGETTVDRPLTEEEIDEQMERVYYSSLEVALVAHEPVYRLDLANQEIEALSSRIGELKELRRLDLSNNNLTDIPDEIGNLTKLKTLNLSNNSLSSLPEEVSNLKILEKVDLIDNQFKEEDEGEIREMFPETTEVVFRSEEDEEEIIE